MCFLSSILTNGVNTINGNAISPTSKSIHDTFLNWKLYILIMIYIWAPPSEFVSSSIPSWQTLTAHAQPFRGARDLVFCLKVPLDSLLVWASSGGSGETARMRRLAWTFAARIGDKYQIRLARPIFKDINRDLNIYHRVTKVDIWKAIDWSLLSYRAKKLFFSFESTINFARNHLLIWKHACCLKRVFKVLLNRSLKIIRWHFPFAEFCNWLLGESLQSHNNWFSISDNFFDINKETPCYPQHHEIFEDN